MRELVYPALKPPSDVYTKVDVYHGEPTSAPTFAHYTHSYPSDSGWYNTYLKWTYNFTVNYARSTIHASYRNDIAGRVLCGILWGSTYSSHYPTEVRGYRDGHAEYSANTTKSGNCSYPCCACIRKTVDTICLNATDNRSSDDPPKAPRLSLDPPVSFRFAASRNGRMPF